MAGNISFSADPESAAASRSRILEEYGPLGLKAFAEARQVHADAIVFDPPASEGPGAASPEADGLASSRPGLGLAIKTADCQPVLLADWGGRFALALHVGWRGNRINFPGKAVQRFCAAYGLEPASLFAVRGPSLGDAEFVNFDSEWGPEFERWRRPQTRAVDLWQLTRFQLHEAGLPQDHIYEIDICTAANPDLFFSHRKRRDRGRQAGIIWLTGPENPGAALENQKGAA